jgi:3-phosphoshikimate 1-carboxyvinyltransferase
VDILKKSGVVIEISNVKEEWKEQRGTIEIFGAESMVKNPFNIISEDIPLLIDEIPILSVLAAFCKGETIISGASELKNKETDRLSAIVKKLTAFGLKAKGSHDGLIIYGSEDFVPSGCAIEHFGDHRIAMAFAIMGLRSKDAVTISDASVVSISYPNFFQDLALVAGSGRIRIS